MGRPEKEITRGDARAELARKLRALRLAEEPQPTYQQLAARAHYSPPSLSQAASPDARAPTWDVVRAYVEALGGDPAEFVDVWTKARKAENASAHRQNYGSQQLGSDDGTVPTQQSRPANGEVEDCSRLWYHSIPRSWWIVGVVVFLATFAGTVFCADSPTTIVPSIVAFPEFGSVTAASSSFRVGPAVIPGRGTTRNAITLGVNNCRASSLRIHLSSTLMVWDRPTVLRATVLLLDDSQNTTTSVKIVPSSGSVPDPSHTNVGSAAVIASGDQPLLLAPNLPTGTKTLTISATDSSGSTRPCRSYDIVLADVTLEAHG